MALIFSEDTVLEHVQLNNMVLGAKGWGVLEDPDSTSLAVIARSPAIMGVRVSIGNCRIDGTVETEAGTTDLTIEAAHVTLHRKDLITYDASANTPAVVKGTDHAGGTGDPIYPPDIPAGDILLGMVDVDASTTTIVTADIHDMRIFIEAAEPGWTYSGASAFSGSAPTSWTDLDLSSIVGSNRAVVLLKLKNTGATDPTFAFRPNGDSDDYSYSTVGSTPSNFQLYHAIATLVTVQTDASGIIEWECTSAIASTIHVMSYSKLT